MKIEMFLIFEDKGEEISKDVVVKKIGIFRLFLSSYYAWRVLTR